MKFNFFKPKETISSKKEESDKLGFTKSELAEYDKYVDFYYTNIINALILFTYNSEQLEKMTSILINPLIELYEELDHAFTPVCFETVFRNNLINKDFKEELFIFKNQVDIIPNELWEWEFLDQNTNWKQIRANAEKLLNKLEITSRTYNDKYSNNFF